MLEWARKNEEHITGEERLEGISLDELRNLFGVSQDTPEDPVMYYVYKVEPRHVARLQQCVQTRIDLDVFDYWVAATRRILKLTEAATAIV